MMNTVWKETDFKNWLANTNSCLHGQTGSRAMYVVCILYGLWKYVDWVPFTITVV